MKVRKKSRDNVEVTVSIPKNLLVQYATEPVCLSQSKSDCRRYVDFIFHMALYEQYRKIVAGGDADDSRG